MFENLIIEDTTLRDGEQSPCVAFSKETKIEIYKNLVKAGIKWMEVGIPAMGGSEAKVLREICERSVSDNTNVIAWNRGILEDIKYSISLGFKALHIGLPTSNIHLQHSVKKDRLWLLSTSADLVKYAKDQGAFVSVSAEDIGRTEIKFLKEYANNIYEAGADRLRLSDTIGILTPEKYAEIISSIKSEVPIDLQCHAHNDFGLAVANTISALKAGAKYFHTTINGIGERAGMADTAQVVLALKQLYSIDIGIKTEQLSNLSKLIAKHTKVNVYPWHPIVGRNVFAHESGIHAKATINHSQTFEPFQPETVGGERLIIIGKHSGKNSIKFKLKQMGINFLNDEILQKCLEKVREISMINQSSLSDEELIKVYKEVC